MTNVAKPSAPTGAAPTGNHRPGGWLTGVEHYENFPVASVLVPRRLRPPLVAIYRFARYADDVADEGDAPAAERLAELASLRRALVDPAEERHPIVDQLRPHMTEHALSENDFVDLLSAFEQDVQTCRYRDYPALLDYCTRSANPIGRLMLQLFGSRNANTVPLSDAICSALQLINFLQDLAIDWSRGRLYLPLDELSIAGLDTAAIHAAVSAGRSPDALRALLAGQASRCGALLESGAPLVRLVPERLAWELRAILAGGRRILEQLSACGFDPIATRPALGWRDSLAMIRLIFATPTTR